MKLYAGFWKRFLALVIDWMACLACQFTIGFVIGFVIAIVDMSRHIPINVNSQNPVYEGVALVVWFLFYTIFESSPLQATPGKLALGIRVTNVQGNRIGFGQATGRLFSKIVSALILYVGFMMAGWTKQKQALHDKMAHTLVVNWRQKVVETPNAASFSG